MLNFTKNVKFFPKSVSTIEWKIWSQNNLSHHDFDNNILSILLRIGLLTRITIPFESWCRRKPSTRLMFCFGRWAACRDDTSHLFPDSWLWLRLLSLHLVTLTWVINRRVISPNSIVGKAVFSLSQPILNGFFFNMGHFEADNSSHQWLESSPEDSWLWLPSWKSLLQVMSQESWLLTRVIPSGLSLDLEQTEQWQLTTDKWQVLFREARMEIELISLICILRPPPRQTRRRRTFRRRTRTSRTRTRTRRRWRSGIGRCRWSPSCSSTWCKTTTERCGPSLTPKPPWSSTSASRSPRSSTW